MTESAPDSLLDLSALKLLAEFGAGRPTPGSGSAAALVSLVGCKLLQTVVSLTASKAQYADVTPQLRLTNQDIITTVEPFLLDAVNRDSRQFARVIEARRARNEAVKGSKARRRLAGRALRELTVATEVVLEIAEQSVALARAAVTVFDLGFKSARGDSCVALSSALAGATGALSIVYLNLGSYRESAWARTTRAEADEHNVEAGALHRDFVARVVGLGGGRD